MKKLIFASGLIGLMACLNSCEKADIYPEEFDSVFSIRDAGVKDFTLYATDEVVEIPLVVMKGGYDPAVKSTATLKVMSADEFDEYKVNTGALKYMLIDPACYSFLPDENSELLSMKYVFDSAEKKAETAVLYVRPAAVGDFFAANEKEIVDSGLVPVIPVMLFSETDTVNANGNVTILKVNVEIPNLTVDIQPVNVSSVSKASFAETPDSIHYHRPSCNFSIPCDNPWGFTLNLIADQDAIEDYNDVTGRQYIALKPEDFELKTNYCFAPGTTTAALDLAMKLDSLDLKKKYAVAVRIDPQNPITWDSSFNPGSALKVDTEQILYFVVSVNDNAELKLVPLTAAMVTSKDIEPTEGSIANLFDGSEDTHFHSTWSATATHDATYGSYLEITLPEEKSSFKFSITNRKTTDARGYIKTVHLFGTDKKENWPTTPFAIITDMNTQGKLDGSAASCMFGSDDNPYGDGKSYKYIRFCVIESGVGSLTESSSGAFWHASKFELYAH